MSKLLRTDRFRTYSITQLCREFGATTRALRFYEEQGLLSPARNQMRRVYSYRDRARLQLIVRGRQVGLTLAQIRDILDTYDGRGEAAQNQLALTLFQQRLEALAAERRQIESAMETLTAAVSRLAGQGSTQAA